MKLIRINEKIIFFLSIFYIFFLFFLFYPPFYSIMDECDYLTTSYTLKKGTFFLDKAGIYPTTATVIGEKHMFSKFPPGNSILLFPFTSINWRFGFLVNFILYLLTFFIFLQILTILNIPYYFSILLLLHPSLVLYSRTMMSDIPSMFFILSGIYLIMREKYFLSGLFLGYSLLLRYSNAVIIFGILLGYIILKRKAIFSILLGILIFLVIQAIYNIFVMEGLFAPFYLPTGAGGHSLGYLKKSGLYYILALNLIYPLMLLIFFSSLKQKKYIILSLPTLLNIFFFSFYYYIDKGNTFYETLIKGQRFMIPVLPLLIIIYSDFIKKIRYVKHFLFLSSILLLIISFLISLKLYNFQKEKLLLKDIVYNNTIESDIVICNGEVGKLINPFFGNKKWKDYSIYGKLIIKKDDFKDYKNIYLCFIDSGKEGKEKEIFFDSVLVIFNVQKIIELEKPKYLVIYRVIDN